MSDSASGKKTGARTSVSTLIPDIKVKPPGSTTPADVFSTVPLVVDEDCQDGALLCTCSDTVDEEEDDDEEEDGVDCAVPGRLDAVLIRSCRDRQTGRMRLRHTLVSADNQLKLKLLADPTEHFNGLEPEPSRSVLQEPSERTCSGFAWCMFLLLSVNYLSDLRAAFGLRHLVGEVGLLKACSAHSLVGGRVGARRRVRRVEAGLNQSFAGL